MTEREALRLALEALEEINKLSIGKNAVCLPAEIDTAMDAIKQALEQPEPEPVGYLYVTDPWGAPEYHFSVEKKEGYFNEPVYKHPPKREPLTGQDLVRLWKESDGDSSKGAERFARAIEAAHGIKGYT